MMSSRTFALISSLVLLHSSVQGQFHVTPVQCIRRAERQRAALRAALSPSSSRVNSETESQAISLDRLEGALTSVETTAGSDERSDEAAVVPVRQWMIIHIFTLFFSLVVRFVCSFFRFIIPFQSIWQSQEAQETSVLSSSRVTNSETESHQEVIGLDQPEDGTNPEDSTNSRKFKLTEKIAELRMKKERKNRHIECWEKQVGIFEQNTLIFLVMETMPN